MSIYAEEFLHLRILLMNMSKKNETEIKNLKAELKELRYEE